MTGTGRHIDYLTWAMLAIGVGIFGFVFFYVGDLQNSVTKAHRELATDRKQLQAMNTQLALATKRLEEQKTLAAQQAQQIAALNTALPGLQKQIADSKAAVGKACADLDAALQSLPSSPELMKVRSDICPEIDKTLQTSLDDTKRAALITEALQQRLQGNIRGSTNSFQRALKVEGGTSQSQAQTLTLYGYSLLRSGKIAEARKTTEQALRLDPHSTLAGINNLKLMCTQKVPAEAARQAYKRLLDTRAGKAGDLCDAELFRVCGYAELGPTSKCAAAD